MKFIIDVKDSKVIPLMKMMVDKKLITRIIPISEGKANLIEEIKMSIKELNLVKEGKAKARPVSELINEL